MGYDLHITRKEHWADEEGPAIQAEERLRLVEGDPELEIDSVNGPYFALCSREGEIDEPWLDWFEGDLFSKNPRQWFVRKMIGLAKELGARVQGDDGEIYRVDNLEELFAGTETPPDSAPTGWLRTWVRSIFQRFRRGEPMVPPPDFEIGDRVRDPWGNEARVIVIDRWAEHGAGRVEVRYDDGRSHSGLLISPLFERVESDGKGESEKD